MSILTILRRKFRPEGFIPPPKPFGARDTERCIEIPWAFSCYRGEKKVLDVGYANAEERYLKGLLSLGIPQLYGLDRVKKNLNGIIPVIGDIRKTDFAEGFFDLIFCISTIEHVGRDNSIYYNAKEKKDDLGDFKAIKELSRITRVKGRIVLTVPYGKLCDYGWFIQYDRLRLKKLIEESECKSILENFFLYQGFWQKCNQDELNEILYRDNGAPAAAGLACILLEKQF